MNLSADAQTFLQGIDHPILREQARDYFVNQQFRKDLYVRGATRLPPIVQRERLLATRFVLLQSAETIDYKVVGALGEATLQEAVYKPVIAALAAGSQAPKTLRQVAKTLPEMAWAALQQALAVLVGKGAVAPCHDEAASKMVRTRCQALNSYLCERAQFGNEIEVLASPVIGGGVAVNRFQQLFLRARSAGKTQPAEWAQYAWQIVAAQGQRLVKEGKALESAEDNLAELNAQAADFADRQLPVLKALQVA